MASGSGSAARRTFEYPTSDGRPMAETDWHRDLMIALIQTLKFWFSAKRRVYVSGNLLVYYIPGNKRRHLSPDVFVVKGVAKHDRPYFLIWEEGKSPQVVIELTSSSTRHEDLRDKLQLYQDTLKVLEYFLFDPLGDYLDPPLRGFRLHHGIYQPIRPIESRLPSKVLGLHLERNGRELRLYSPATGQWLLTPAEMVTEAEFGQQRAEIARQQAEADNERLRRELEELRRSPRPS